MTGSSGRSTSDGFEQLVQAIKRVASETGTGDRWEHTDPRVLLGQAEALYQGRRKRNRIFGDHAGLFGEPNWDMLLAIFIDQMRDREVDVTSAAVGAHAAPTTGLRCLRGLQEAGLVRRSEDPFDKRRSLVKLTAEGVTLITRYLMS